MRRYETHYEKAQEGPRCGTANAIDTTPIDAHVTCQSCRRLRLIDRENEQVYGYAERFKSYVR